MRDFFHCDTEHYVRMRKYILWIALLPVFLGSVIAVIIITVNFRVFYEHGYLKPMLYATTGAVLIGSVFYWLVFLFTEKAVKRQARYTYFEINDKLMVFSRYNGEYIKGGKRVVLRKIFVILLSDLKSVGYGEKNGAVFIETDGDKIREYSDKSERLNYCVAGNRLDFESWWYNENGFSLKSELKIPAFFGSSEAFCASIAQAKKRFDQTPARAPYVHKELDFIRRRKAWEMVRKLNDF